MSDRRLYICVDFEGACAVVGRPGEDVMPGTAQYDFARRMVTAETNAAIEGALEAGVTDVVVYDAHGAGLNLDYEELHPAARILASHVEPRRMLGLEPGFTGVFLIAYHAMAGTDGGVLAHSYSSEAIQHMWLNEVRVGEIGLDAALAGSLGVPALLVTSDAAGAEEARSLLGQAIGTVAVKQGLGRNCALSLHPARAQRLIRAAAADAVRQAGGIEPLRFRPPYRLRRLFKLESQAEQALRANPVAVRIDSRTVEAVSEDLFSLI